MLSVVTGASGHVGANLVRELLRRGHRVRAVVHRDARALEGLEVERVRGDVCDPASLRAAFAGADVLYHLAGVVSVDADRGGVVRATNVDGVRNAAAAALECGVRRMVHCSSVHAFVQEPLGQPLDETRPLAGSPPHPAYGRSKAAGEVEVRRAIERGLDAVIVNPTGIIGPHDHGPSRMGRVFLKLYQRRLVALVGGGCDWVDIRDVAAGLAAAAERGRRGENYLLSGYWHSIDELAAMATEVTGMRRPRFTAPLWLARAAAPFAAAFARLRGTDPLFAPESLRALSGNRRVVRDKAARELGYAPRPTRETVADVYGWFGAQGLVALRRGDTPAASSFAA